MSLPDAFLYLDKPGTPQLYFVKGDTANYVFKYYESTENATVVGVVDGVNKIFTVPSSVTAANLVVFLNGSTQTYVTQYTYASGTITFVTAPPSGSVVTASYSGPVDLSGLTAAWSITNTTTGSPLYTGTGTIDTGAGSITVVLSGTITSALNPVGTGLHASTFVGTLSVTVTDGTNVKTLERASLQVVV